MVNVMALIITQVRPRKLLVLLFYNIQDSFVVEQVRLGFRLFIWLGWRLVPLGMF